MAATAPIQHYVGYKPQPFTRQQRENTTILFGGLTWKHERLVQAIFHNLGYKAEPLPNISRKDLDSGRELIDVGACCPTIFTTGNLANFLSSKVLESSTTEVADKYVFLTAGACGPCRFGQYQQSYAMALDGLGLRDFRLLLLAQDQLDQKREDSRGLEINPPLSLGIIYAIFCADLLTDIEYMTRPYEIVPGQTDKVLRDSIEDLYEVFRSRPLHKNRWRTFGWHLWTGYFTHALRNILKKWESIQVDRLRVKPKVKITGEFWIQTHEGDGNYGIKRWLEQEGAEVVPPPVAVWLNYLFHPMIRDLKERKNQGKYPKLKRQAGVAVERLYCATYARLRKALGNLPHELPDQVELLKLAESFFHFELRGGEGHMLIGKALQSYKRKLAHMICELSPYSCMPNTMSIGAMAGVLGQYPDLLYAPIEVKGDAEVHALSRCQMILSEARRRAQHEFDSVLQSFSLTVDEIRDYERTHPELRRMTHAIPHMGHAGTAANYAAHVAQRMGLRPAASSPLV